MTSPEFPTLQTVADAAGVSRSSVSLAMRNHPSLPLATRERIQKVAEEVGYHPNPMISALMANLKASKPVTDRGVIAFLTSYDTRDGWRKVKVFSDYFLGATAQANKLGYRVEEFWLKEPLMTAARMTTVLETRNVAGVIVAPFPAGRGHLSLDVGQFATVALGYSMTLPKLHRVANHHIESMRMALREIKQRGYRRIAMVFYKIHDSRVNHNYSAGYLTFQQTLQPEECLPICWIDDMSKEEFQSWMKKYRPQAVICPAPEELTWLMAADVGVPDKIALASLCEMEAKHGRIAGVCQMGMLTGAVAVDVIVGQIHRNERGVPITAKVTLTEGRWVDGDTMRMTAGATADQGDQAEALESVLA